MKLIARSLAFALALAPAIALANQDHKPDLKAQSEKSDESMSKRGDDATAKGESAQEPMTESRIAAMLHQVNKMEIEAGELAQKKGQSTGVKDFGRTLVKDHQDADRKLTQLAKKASLDLNDLSQVEKEKLRVDKEKMEQVKKMSGAEFDRAFASVMYNGHDGVLKMLDDHQKDIRSPELKQFVDATRPKLEDHRDMAKKLEGGAKAMGRRSSEPKRDTDTRR